jgi:hypothetical protein
VYSEDTGRQSQIAISQFQVNTRIQARRVRLKILALHRAFHHRHLLPHRAYGSGVDGKDDTLYPYPALGLRNLQERYRAWVPCVKTIYAVDVEIKSLCHVTHLLPKP